MTIPSASTLFGGDCNTLIQPTSTDLRKIRIDIVKDTATNKPTAFANQYCTILSYVNTQICTDYWQVSNPNETYIRHLNPAYNTWSSWQRIDNFGCNTPADLASLLGEKVPGSTALIQRFYTVNVAPSKSYLVGGYNSLVYVVPAGQSAISGLYLSEGGAISTIKASDSRLSVSWDGGMKFISNFPSNVQLRILVFQLQ